MFGRRTNSDQTSSARQPWTYNLCSYFLSRRVFFFKSQVFAPDGFNPPSIQFQPFRRSWNKIGDLQLMNMFCLSFQQIFVCVLGEIKKCFYIALLRSKTLHEEQRNQNTTLYRVISKVYEHIQSKTTICLKFVDNCPLDQETVFIDGG